MTDILKKCAGGCRKPLNRYLAYSYFAGGNPCHKRYICKDCLRESLKSIGLEVEP